MTRRILTLFLLLCARAACDQIRVDWRDGTTGNFAPINLTAVTGQVLTFDASGNPIIGPGSSMGGAGGHATFTLNSATAEPVIGDQLRLNNFASQIAATRLWVSQMTVDGLDATIGLAKIKATHQIYIQDRNDASKWVKYTVTADGVDDGSYWDFTIAYHSGPGGVPTGQIEFQPIAPGTVGVPPGGTTGQLLAKNSATDYDVEWITGGGGGGVAVGDSPTWTGRHAFSAAGAASAPTLALTGAPFTGGDATTTKPLLLLEPTGTTSTGWSTAGTMLGVNAPAGIGNLINAKVNGADIFSVSGISGVMSVYGGISSSTGSIVAAESLGLGTSGLISWAGGDTSFTRAGVGNVRIGTAPWATPRPYTLTIGEASRPGTDSNTAGANGTIQSGLGTGTGTPSSLIFQTPTVASGSSAQTYATRLTLDANGATIDALDHGTTLSTDDTSRGQVRTGLTNSGGVTQWDAVYLNASSQWVLADANGTGTYPCRGLVTAAATTGLASTVVTCGTVRNDAWTWTPGGTVYLSVTAGGLTQTAPATTGDKIQVIGYALDADTLAVEISSDYGTAP